jgi:hypothetical protein
MRQRLTTVLAVLVALFVGAVPLRECLAVESFEVGVAVFGEHAHDDHAPCGHRHDHDTTRHVHPEGESDCCADAPFEIAFACAYVRADRVVDTGAVAVGALPATHLARLASGAAAEPPRLDPPPDPRADTFAGVLSAVLLR